AILLGHQAALQPVGEPRDDALEIRELLVEIAPQPIELLGLAQFVGRHYLVELGDERPVIGAARLVDAVPAWAPRLGRRLGVAHLGVVRHFGGQRLGGFRGGVGHFLARDLGLVHARLGILGLLAFAVFAGLVLALVLVALGALLVVGFRAAILAHV